VKFKVDGAVQGSAVALSAGAASIALTGLKSGSHTLSATYSGDVNYATVTPASESITIKAAAVVPTKVTLARTGSSLQSCTASLFTVEVSSTSKSLPTGKVELLNGSTVLASGSLVQGAATLKLDLSKTGKAALVAHYLGDAHHKPGASAQLKVTPTNTIACKAESR